MAEVAFLGNNPTPQASEDGTLQSDGVGHAIIGVRRQLRSWTKAREKPSRQMGVWTQKWLTSFGAFLTNYSGIVEIMKGADQQYGGLAYGLLSVLLALPINKSQHEADIVQALDEFSLAFPRLQSLKAIYPEQSDTLKRLIASLYTEVVLFTRQCVDYFEGSSFGMFSHRTNRIWPTRRFKAGSRRLLSVRPRPGSKSKWEPYESLWRRSGGSLKFRCSGASRSWSTASSSSRRPTPRDGTRKDTRR